MSADVVAKSAEDLKKIFAQYPGSNKVFIQVGSNTIKSPSTIAWNDDVAQALEAVVGGGSVVFKE